EPRGRPIRRVLRVRDEAGLRPLRRKRAVRSDQLAQHGQQPECDRLLDQRKADRADSRAGPRTDVKGGVMRFCGTQFTLRRMGRLPVPAVAAAAPRVAAACPLAGAASAGRPIPDPPVLQPPPPPGAVCRADGPHVICDTFLDTTLENEPVFDLPCGTVYETS